MMLMGREVAVGLGVSVEREYRVLLFVSVLLQRPVSRCVEGLVSLVWYRRILPNGWVKSATASCCLAP